MKISLYKKSTRLELCILTLFAMLCILIFPITSFSKDNQMWKNILIIIISGSALFMMFYYLFRISCSSDYNGTIEINKEAVSYKTKQRNVVLKWEDIRLIGFWKSSLRYGNKYLLFIRYPLNNALAVNLDPKLISEDFIYVQYRIGIIKEIKKYWPYEIVNEKKFSSE